MFAIKEKPELTRCHKYVFEMINTKKDKKVDEVHVVSILILLNWCVFLSDTFCLGCSVAACVIIGLAACDFSCGCYVLWLYSTSPSGVNQVDGLPPASIISSSLAPRISVLLQL